MPKPHKSAVAEELADWPVNEARSRRRSRARHSDGANLVSSMNLDGESKARSSRKNRGQAPNSVDASRGTAHHGTSRSNSGAQSGKWAAKSGGAAADKQATRYQSHRAHASQAPKLTELKPLSSSEHTNVTCRFVLRSDSQVEPATCNVDKPIPVKQLWRIFSPTQECPICLEAAEVPRMLGCGHIMCFHCMIKHRKFSAVPDICPICGEVVALIPSRSTPVTFLDSDALLLPKEDEEVVLTLMSRPANSVVALPVNLELPSSQSRRTFPSPDNILWTRICRGDVEYAKQELAAEVKYLIRASKRDIGEFGADDEGYGEAASELKKFIHALNANGPDPTYTVRERAPVEPDSSENVYFYQTAFESSVVYTLGALDVSILKAAFGSFDRLPTTLIARITNIDFGILDRTNFKRMKFLSHIPEQTAIAFMECDWTGVVAPEVLDKFRSKLIERTKSKERRLAQDLVERQKATKAIDEQFKHEVAEAMLPHDGMAGTSTAKGIDTDQLPTLKKNSKAAENIAAAQEQHRRIELQQAKEYEELMQKAYVPKKGRKDIIIRL